VDLYCFVPATILDSMNNTTVSKWILFVGDTFPGHRRDSSMLKAEFSPGQPWFETFHALLELG
jgi:hypothetical protein